MEVIVGHSPVSKYSAMNVQSIIYSVVYKALEMGLSNGTVMESLWTVGSKRGEHERYLNGISGRNLVGWVCSDKSLSSSGPFITINIHLLVSTHANQSVFIIFDISFATKIILPSI